METIPNNYSIMKYLTLLLFALFVFACGDATTDTSDRMEETAEETASDMSNRASEVAPPRDMDNSAVQSTIDAVQSKGGDITALAPGTAVSNIDTWISKLSDMDGTDAIVSDLESLKTELTASSIDGSKVSNLLSSLASKTREVGQGNPGLNTIAGALDAGASKLAGK